MTKQNLWSTKGAAAVVLATAIGGILATFASYQFALKTEQLAAEQRFMFARAETVAAIEARMRNYESVLRGSNSVFEISQDLTRQQWHDFTSGLQLDRNFPGIQALGYAEWVQPENKMGYEATVRSEGFPDFRIKPDGIREAYTSITFIEPMDLRNQQAFGFDMWSEETRRSAMAHARDTGEITISGPVKLVQEIDSRVQAGILMYLPHYVRGDLSTTTARQAANAGFVYGAFRMDDLMAGILGSDQQHIEIEIFDTTSGDQNNLLYTSDASKDAAGKTAPLTATDAITVYGRTWQLASRGKPSLFMHDGGVSLGQVAITASAGASLFLLILVLLALNTRKRAADIAKHITHDLDQRTEELSASLRRQVRIEDELRSLVTTDTLTGLANRSAFNVWLKDAGKQHQGTCVFPTDDVDGGHSIMMMDLDRFKTINDTLGHLIGDELLSAVGARLKSELPNDCRLARLGGDEFAVLVPDDQDQTESLKLANQIRSLFVEPFECDGRYIKTTCSIGMAFISTAMPNPERAMSQADIALYRAKDTGRGVIKVFDEALEAETVRRATIEDALDGALARREFHLEFQPKIGSNGGDVVGAEVLLRWVHPTMGFIPPDMFIQTAEETGYIESISAWILDATCEQMRTWMDNGVTDIPLAINLSSQQLQSPELIATVTNTLRRHNIPPEKLEIEITESMLIDDFEQAYQRLKQLRDIGIKIALDDFGTGYSSLSYLHKLEVDVLKIDRSFVGSLETPQSRTIVQSIMTLAKTLNLSTVGEGVETVEQAQFLRANGCDEMQGWLFSRSLRAEDLEKWLADADAMTTSAKLAVV
ncbi:EAL domain-containing protein [Pyruvatibacter sp.]|uniref:putative bifunctional diguanylate cyclase/phosphodiesterase n=1 Tax=Pyruvatibacter sp. TaxID=1981328 RepID=UPI003267C3F9